jgi:hypothetical protein
MRSTGSRCSRKTRTHQPVAIEYVTVLISSIVFTWGRSQEKLQVVNVKNFWGVVAPACNPSYSGSRDWEDHTLRPDWTKSSETPHVNHRLRTSSQPCGISNKVVVQVGPSINVRPYSKSNLRQKSAEGMPWVIEHQCHKHSPQVQTPVLPKKIINKCYLIMGVQV